MRPFDYERAATPVAAVRIADVHDHGAAAAHGLRLFWRDAFEVCHAGFPCSHSQRCISPLSRFIKVMALPQTQPVSSAKTFGSSH